MPTDYEKLREGCPLFNKLDSAIAQNIREFERTGELPASDLPGDVMTEIIEFALPLQSPEMQEQARAANPKTQGDARMKAYDNFKRACRPPVS